MIRVLQYFAIAFSVVDSMGVELTPVIITQKGPIQGSQKVTVGKHMRYWSFEGIPYAKPPVGYLRFKPPEEVDAWKYVKDATKPALRCPQPDNLHNNVAGKEDCLYLNVYTPKINESDTELRAVIFWIYGGANSMGLYYDFGPDFLLEENVVFVTLNYRLGALGFLHVEHENATGNAGLKDQKMALEWVQKNIRKFGGDPKRVTIFGQSVGSVAVQLQVLSESSKGLFSGAISSSGSPLNIWAMLKPCDASRRSYILGRHLEVDTSNAETLLKGLYTKSAEEIISATNKMKDEIDFTPDTAFRPTIEPSYAPNPFLTNCTVDKYRKGDFSRVPMIIGFVHSETATLVTKTPLRWFVNETYNYDNDVLELENIKFMRSMISKPVDELKKIPKNRLYDLVNITSGLLFASEIDKTQQYLASHTKPVYYYRNSFDYKYALSKIAESNVEEKVGDLKLLNGTAHGDDNAHILWVANHNQSLNPHSDIGLQRRRMTRMWANFAKYRNPTPGKKADPLLGVIWPDSTEEGLHLEIDKKLSVGPRPIDSFVQLVQGLDSPNREIRNGCPAFGVLI